MSIAGISGAVIAIAAAAVYFAFVFAIRAVAGHRIAAAAREAASDLGPGEPTGAGAPAPSGGSLAARAIRPVVARLDRAWRQYSAEIVARLGAAEAIIAAAPDPLIVIDRTRRIVRANTAAAEFIGPTGEPRDLAAALRNPVLLAATDAVLAGGPATSVEFTLAVPIERVLRAQVTGIEGASAGRGAIISLHDVTELKRSEQMRADFIANAGHEMKTPLATLTGFIETLLGPAREDAAARERFLAIMKEQTERMARLVDDLLSLSQIELNEHVAPTGRVALAPLVDEVARGLELRARERDIRIVRDLPDDLPAALGDRDELAQILQNLLDNAVKYARPASEVTVTGDAAGGTVQIAVSDKGDGIAAEHLPRLTERFYRVDTARSRELGGTGLGLAIVKHIVSRHRGRLEIASTPGEGSTFTVSLPTAAAETVIDR